MKRPPILLAALFLAVTLFAACGSDEAASDTSTQPAGTEASVPASDLDLDGKTFVSTAVDGHELVADSEVRLTFQDASISINAGCNTLVGGYTIEGHVPVSDIQRLLKEKPAIAGIAVPGMPMGSPGMEQGGRKDPFDTIAFTKAGKKTVFAAHK